MHDSSATKSIRLLKPWTLLLAAGAVGGLLLLTYHGEEVFLPDGQQPDAVSANYAELLLAAHPEDAKLRLELIQLLIDLGEYERAARHLRDWEHPDAAQVAYYQLEIEILQALQKADPQLLQAARERLLAFDQSTLSIDQLKRLARHALALELPAHAAQIYQLLAERDAEQRREHLKEAGRWYLAGNRPQLAGEIFHQLMLGSERPEERLHYLRESYAALLAAGQGERASLLLADELERLQDMPLDPAWLAQGVQVAMGSQRYDLADRMVLLWRELQPDSPEALQAEFDLHLAYGDIQGAWGTGQRLLELRPQDADLLQQMARLGEWNSYHAEALDYWIRYLQLRPDAATREHAWRLAIQLFDFDRGIPLLAGVAEQRRLTDIELDALIYSHESRGTPEQAERWLRGYLRGYPGHRLAWMRLIQNLENTQQYAAEAEAWEAMSRHFSLSTSERVDWAQVHWKLFDAQRAWQVLDVDYSAIDDPEYWRVRAGLAWELERDEDLLLAYEQMLARDIRLTFAEERQLIALYRPRAPRKALDLLVDSWRRTGDAQRLFDALQLAEALELWPLFKQLVAEGEANPAAARWAPLLAARGRLAEYEGRLQDAERLYRLGIARFPGDGQFRERLLWFYVDHGRRSELPLLLQQWRGLARNDSRLWLPFAAASQMLGRNEQALAWYRRYLRGNAGDWLVQAAYVDALEAAGRFDQAQRMRRVLIARFDGTPGDDQPQRYGTWLRMLASSHSQRFAGRAALRWQDGSPAMLQLWFDRLLDQLDANNQEAQKDAWLAWGRSRGLRIDSYDQIQQALRSWNRKALEQLLAQSELDDAQRVEALNRLGEDGQALGFGLSVLGDEQSPAVREQLWRQAIEAHERFPQGIRLGWQKQDFGGLELLGPQLSVARHLGNDWYASLDLLNGSYDSSQLDEGALGRENGALLQLRRQLADGSLELIFDSSLRSDEDRHGLGLVRRWELDADHTLEVGLDWQRESLDSGLMRALGQHDGLWLRGQHALSARDALTWSVGHNRFATRYGDDLGQGQAYSLEYNHTLRFEGPTWVLRTGVDYRSNSLRNAVLPELPVDAGGPVRQDEVVASDLLQARYGQVYIGSSWRRGFPGALNRTRGQYTWLVDMSAGWQWTDSSFNYGISTGLGTAVLGDDELAVTLGYQSAPRGADGEAGGTLGVSYSLRFGR